MYRPHEYQPVVYHQQDSLSKQIGEHCKTAIEGINTDQALAEFGLSNASSRPTSAKEIGRLRDKIQTGVRDGTPAGMKRAFDALEEAANHKDADVKSVFEGVHTALCKATNAPSPIIRQLVQLETTVKNLETSVKHTMRNAEPGAFSSKESNAIIAVVASAKETIAKHQANPFANTATLAQAKQELKGELKKFETSLELRSFFARAGEIVDSIKKSIVEAVKKIGSTGVPAMAKEAMVAKSTTINFLKTDVQTAKLDINSKEPPPSMKR